jgi:hypothetical protein
MMLNRVQARMTNCEDVAPMTSSATCGIRMVEFWWNREIKASEHQGISVDLCSRLKREIKPSERGSRDLSCDRVLPERKGKNKPKNRIRRGNAVLVAPLCLTRSVEILAAQADPIIALISSQKDTQSPCRWIHSTRHLFTEGTKC